MTAKQSSIGPHSAGAAWLILAILGSSEPSAVLSQEPAPVYGWTRTIGGSDHTYCRGVALSQDESVYVAGDFSGIVDFDPTDGTDIREANSDDIFLTKLNTDGSYAWTHTWWGEGRQVGKAVAVDSEGNLFLMGRFANVVDFDPTGGVDIHGSPTGTAWMFVTRLGSDGSYAWTRSVAGNLSPHDVAVNAGGDVAVCGTFAGTSDFDPSGGIDTHVARGGRDIFVSRLDLRVPSSGLLPALRFGDLHGEL